MKIAIQKNGRLNEESLSFLATRGIFVKNPEGELMVTSEDGSTEVLFIRDDDIPEYVRCGVVDFGIVGKNLLLEKNIQLPIVEELNFAYCDLVLAVPETSDLRCLGDLEGLRIATTYSAFLASHLKFRGIRSAIISIKGSVEITPRLNLADAVCDLTQTGKTLKANGLRIIETIFKSQAVLIASSPTLSFPSL